MKKLRLSWAALSLLAPVLIFSALFLGPAGCKSGSSSVAAPSPTAANVQVGFVTDLSGVVSPASIQSFILNVTGVRMNPLPNSSNSATPSETSGKWVAIPVPTATATGSIPGDVPVNVVEGESQLQVFNTFGVGSGKFITIEVDLDTTNPGSIVPLCAGGSLEGCISYPIQLQNVGNSIQFQYAQNAPLQTKQMQTVNLPILLSANVVSTPSGPGKPYIVDVSASQPANAAAAYIGTVTGKVAGAKGNGVSKHSHLKVTAELEGTNTVVASSNVFNSSYSLFLPAAADIGTFYDFYLSGGTANIVAIRGVNGANLFPNATSSVAFTTTGGQTIGGFSGQVTDSCTKQPIVGATLQVLAPPANNSGVNCVTTPQNCVSVASATSGSSGSYPIPGSVNNPAAFTKIPIGSPTVTYTMEISAPGYDTLFMDAQAAVGGSSGSVAAGRCSTPMASPSSTATPANGTCSFALTTAYIQGNVNLTAAQPPGTKTTVQVFAEDTGTSQLVSALPSPLTILGGQTTLGFTLNVPSHAFNNPTAARNYDIFAEAQDLYQGGPDPFPGHTIITQQNVPGPPTACATAAPGLFTETMNCVGHGSIAGNASSPNSGTTIELLKNNVALTESSVGPPTPAPSIGTSYSFCVPPDSYTLQRLEVGTPVGTPVAVGAMATPMATSSPCPSTCFSGTGVCPGICSGTTGPTM